MTYNYQEFTRKLPDIDPELESGYYQEATMNPGRPCSGRVIVVSIGPCVVRCLYEAGSVHDVWSAPLSGIRRWRQRTAAPR
jgi:hypothetical protein